MIQTIIPSATYQANILAALQQTGIANTTAGGKARAFCDIVGDQLGILDANKANDIAQSLLPYAYGSNLDLLCQIYGVNQGSLHERSTSALARLPLPSRGPQAETADGLSLLEVSGCAPTGEAHLPCVSVAPGVPGHSSRKPAVYSHPISARSTAFKRKPPRGHGCTASPMGAVVVLLWRGAP